MNHAGDPVRKTPGRPLVMAQPRRVLVLRAQPQSLDQHFTGPDGVDRSLTASIVSVGTFGAYAAIVAVLLVIGGFSLKWGTDPSGRVTPETESHS